MLEIEPVLSASETGLKMSGRNNSRGSSSRHSQAAVRRGNVSITSLAISVISMKTTKGKYLTRKVNSGSRTTKKNSASRRTRSISSSWKSLRRREQT